jgi:hypothetical protein
MSWLDFAVIIFGVVLAFLGVLTNLHFTNAQRARYRLVKGLDGKQILLVTIAILSFGSLVTVATVAVISHLRPKSEQAGAPNGLLVSRVTTAGFDVDVRRRAGERTSEARDYFIVGERYFVTGKYAQAAANYEQSVVAVPTIPANINLGVSREFVSANSAAIIGSSITLNPT